MPNESKRTVWVALEAYFWALIAALGSFIGGTPSLCARASAS
jgi:hypothetical protein